MKYVVSGYIGFDNFGDEAIARVLVERLKKEGAEKITLISANPLRTAELHKVDSCGKFNFFNAIKDADVLISGGGSLLQDVTSLKSLFYYLAVITTALICGKKVEIFAQGIGPINSKTGNFLTKHILKRVDKISVRDSKSQELLKHWGIESVLVDDPVFGINITPKYQKGTVGIQLRESVKLSENKDFLSLLAKELCSKFPDKNFEIISLQNSYDLKICNKFATLLKECGASSVTVFENDSFDSVIDKISSLEYLFAMRFHANVVGIKSEVKTIAINYDPKVEKLAKEYNIPLIEPDGKNLRTIFENINP